MKTTRFLALALIVAISLMGAGYAYWADSVTITNTVQAGKFDVNFKSASPSLWNEDKNDSWQTVTANISEADSKLINVTMSNMYPNSKRATFKFEIKNEGTIPAVFNTIEFTNWANFPQELKDHIHINHVFVDKNGTRFGGKYLSAGRLNNLENELRAALTGLRLDPQETAVIEFPVDLRKEVVNSDNVEEKNGTFGIRINWKQHNE